MQTGTGLRHSLTDASATLSWLERPNLIAMKGYKSDAKREHHTAAETDTGQWQQLSTT
jgi:hypothetical protein